MKHSKWTYLGIACAIALVVAALVGRATRDDGEALPPQATPGAADEIRRTSDVPGFPTIEPDSHPLPDLRTPTPTPTPVQTATPAPTSTTVPPSNPTPAPQITATATATPDEGGEGGVIGGED